MMKLVPAGGRLRQEEDERERVATQMRWDWPLTMMGQQEDHPSTGGKGSGTNEWHRKVDEEDSSEEEEQG